jgi:pilus assembly protein CpaB
MRWIVSVGTLMLIGLAVGLGLGGLFRVQAYLNHQAELHFEAQKGLPATEISVADRWLRSPGSDEPAPAVAGEINRPTDTPASGGVARGGATAIPDITGSTERNPLGAIQGNEANRVSEPMRPQPPVMPKAILGEGKKAVAIRVANVESIAGFLVPGQPVDVVLTRQLEGNAVSNGVVTQDARLLATDRLPTDRNDGPSDARSVVVEVDLTEAQKLVLASQVGTLSLVLRNAGEPRSQPTHRIGVSDLGVPDIAETGIAQQQNKGGFVSVRVNRIGAEPSVHVVPRE